MFFTDSIKLDLLGLCLVLFTSILAWHKWTLGFWKRKGIPGREPTLFFGNAKDLFMGKKTLGEIYKDMYFELKSNGYRHGGGYFMGSHNYIPIDVEIIKSIMQTDFQYFHSHGVYHDQEIDPLSANIFNLEGPKWKDIRSKVSPTFSSSKLKMMHSTVVECSAKLEKLLEESAESNPVDIKDIMNRFTIDVIGTAAFGLDIDSMKNPNTAFKVYGAKVLEPTLLGYLRYLPLMMLPTEILRKLKYSVLQKDVANFFSQIVQTTVNYRAQHNVNRKDFLNLLIELKDNGSLTLSDIEAQCFIFFVAGFETSSSTIQFASYELAVNTDIQEKAREEINRVLKKYDNQLTYEALMEMEYLERVIQETLRKYPPLQYLFRQCTKNYNIIGDEEKQLEKGTHVMIPVLGIHYDPEYYPNPHIFDPNRFTEEEKRKRPPMTWLAFGEGPRICLGLRFGMIESKIGIISLLKNYKISLDKKTLSPIVFSTTGLVSTCKGGIWLNLEKLSKN